MMICDKTPIHYNVHSEEQPRFYLTYNRWSKWGISFHLSKNVNLRKIPRFCLDNNRYYNTNKELVIKWGYTGWAVHREYLPYGISIERAIHISYILQAQIKKRLREAGHD